jgi:hypothetical protein
LQQGRSGKLVRVPRPTIDGELWLSVAWNLAHQTARASDWKEKMPYRISYIDTSMLTDEQITEGILRTEEFPTEPAALARARELLEDVNCKTVLVSDNSGEHLSVVGLPLKPGLTAKWARCRSYGHIRSMGYGRGPVDEVQRNDDQSTFPAAC